MEKNMPRYYLFSPGFLCGFLWQPIKTPRPLHNHSLMHRTTLWHFPLLQTPLDVTWHHFTIQKDSKMVLGSQGFVERRSEGHLQSFRWVGQSVVVLSGTLGCFPPITLSISPPMMRPLSFLMWLVAPKALQIKMSEGYGHFAIFWSLERHFGAEI